MAATDPIDPARLCVHPPCRGPRKCWQYDYCWYYGDARQDQNVSSEGSVHGGQAVLKTVPSVLSR